MVQSIIEIVGQYLLSPGMSAFTSSSAGFSTFSCTSFSSNIGFVFGQNVIDQQGQIKSNLFQGEYFRLYLGKIQAVP